MGHAVADRTAGAAQPAVPPGAAPVVPARRGRAVRRIVLIGALLVMTPALTIAMGPAAVPLHDVFGVIASHVPGLPVDITWDRTIDAIVWRTRLPRIIGSMAVGAILGVSGVVMQAIVRNPLAEPYVLGVSSGASTGAAFAMITLGVSSGGLVGLLAFTGASLATAAVLAVAGRTHSPLHLVLGGLAVGFGFQAVTNLIIFSADSAEAGQSVSFWMLGSMARIGVGDLPRLVVTAGLLAIAMAVLGPVLDALASGDRTAQSVGVEPGRARIWLLLPVSAAVAIAVASAGGIGFIGLIIPHIMRSFIGHSHRLLVVGTALAAALFCVWTDTAARIVFSPTELPLGVITGLVGAPFLILIIRRSRTAW